MLFTKTTCMSTITEHMKYNSDFPTTYKNNINKLQIFFWGVTTIAMLKID